MFDYVTNSKKQYLAWLQLNNPALYNAAMARVSGGMGETTTSDGGFFSKAFDAVSSIAGSIYGAKLQKDSDKTALKQITLENERAAIAARQAAVDTIQRDQYAMQIRALQQQQLEADRGTQDTALMIGGLVLAALVGAKMMKII